MSRSIYFLTMLLMLSCSSSFAGVVESPASCRQCMMDRSRSAQTRVLISYDDGSSSGLCSISCAATELKQNKDKQVKSFQVADYSTSELIEAQEATWVVGGSKEGGMNSPAKWAFARRETAQSFVTENGGELSTFAQLMVLADRQEGAGSGKTPDHRHYHPGGQMLFNPAFADDIYHAHPAGMWMANYKYMRMVQNGLRNGTTDVPAQNATPVGNQPFGFMMAPTSMTMEMHMVMLMYGVNDRLTLMGMGSYLVNEMKMVMNMGTGNVPDSPMRSSGMGDTELRGIYRISPDLSASLGIGLPTGDIDQEVVTMGRTFRAPYDMQLGSGTVDLKPALTYSALDDDVLWNWGGQASYTWRAGRNGNGYSLGDNAKAVTWLQRALGPAASWLRLSYNYTGRIDGRDGEIDKLLDAVDGAPTPDADPNNYGGHRIDGFVGVSWTAGLVSIGVEAGIPFYQYLNGLQLKNDWYLSTGVQGMF